MSSLRSAVGRLYWHLTPSQLTPILSYQKMENTDVILNNNNTLTEKPEILTEPPHLKQEEI